MAPAKRGVNPAGATGFRLCDGHERNTVCAGRDRYAAERGGCDRIGIRIPIEGAKGYSLTMTKPERAPRGLTASILARPATKRRRRFSSASSSCRSSVRIYLTKTTSARLPTTSSRRAKPSIPRITVDSSVDERR